MLGMQIFQLSGNLLTDKDGQSCEKVTKAWTNTIPWEDLQGEVHEKKTGKTWTSFFDCVTFYLQSVFCSNEAEAVKFYITNTLKTKQGSNSTILCVHGAIGQLPPELAWLVQEPKGKLGNQMVMPLKDANLETYLLQMCPFT